MSSSFLHTIHLRFNRALVVVRSIPEHEVGLQPIPMDRLKFYGLYKQATLGECNTPKPSSRKVVEYAKWKAWYRVRHLSSMEAQNLYVNALVELLVEFINRYPNNQYIEFAKEALHSLESDLPAESYVEETGHEAYADAWEPTALTGDGHDPLTHIEPHHLTNYTHLVTSPTISSFFTNDSMASNSPSLHASTTPSSVTHTNDPQTPLLSPQQHKQHPRHYDWQKWSTTNPTIMDVASPLSETARLKNNNDNNKPTTTGTTLMSSPSLSSSESCSQLLPQNDAHNNKFPERTLENLQTEVTALTEQMDRLRQELKDKEMMKQHFGIGWLLRTLIKHLLANSLIAGILFCILWRRRSPLAVALVDHLTPQIKMLLRSMIRSTVKKVMFWKLTV
ncbi:acyl CoA binding protein-domain-containing protein [Absidia repens]|uniref:Acyl CoA binding protein-domain-containing protein n=1 Tax=Absidia repens TaxID=90262 RepID=A0A1X2IL48_9FUNG|nr:acyl CoA binding protein-domain-containing protein [Absidia repens]